MEIQCQKCSKLVLADADGHLPPWCPQCGSSLASAGPDLSSPRSYSKTAAARGKFNAYLFVAIVCGFLVCFLVLGLNQRPQPKVIERELYTVQTTHWEVDEDRQRVLQIDLVLRFKHRGG